MTNPLIDQGSLLNWPAIKTEHITPALDELLAKASDAVAKVTAPETPATWSDVVDPLEQALEKLSRAWSAVGHLSGVMDSDALRERWPTATSRASWTVKRCARHITPTCRA